MPRPLSSRQEITLHALGHVYRKTGAPVPRSTLSLALTSWIAAPSRWLTGTLASLLDRGLIVVPVQGRPAYLPASALSAQTVSAFKAGDRVSYAYLGCGTVGHVKGVHACVEWDGGDVVTVDVRVLTPERPAKQPCPMGCDGQQNPPCPGCYA